MNKNITYVFLGCLLFGSAWYFFGHKKTERTELSSTSAESSNIASTKDGDKLASKTATPDNVNNDSSDKNAKSEGSEPVANSDKSNQKLPMQGKVYRLEMKDNVRKPSPEVQKEMDAQFASYLSQVKNARLVGEDLVSCVSDAKSCVAPPEDNSGRCITRRNLCKDPSQASVVSENELVQKLGAKKAENHRMKMEILAKKGTSRDM